MTAAQRNREHRWQASLAVVVSMALYIALPVRYSLSLRFVVPALEAGLLLVLFAAAPYRHSAEARWARWIGIALIAIVNVANGISLAILIWLLLHHGRQGGAELIRAAIDIWLTNVIVFGLWYWEIDRGGPGRRRIERQHPPDFLFPQMTTPQFAAPNWLPGFIDYLYVAFTNAAAFSPTDTMPLTPLAKSLMLAQSLISLLTLALVAARAVNILS